MLSFADAILQANLPAVQQWIQYGEDVNAIDEYGFTPLIEAAIVEQVDITRLLLARGANPNGQDAAGATPLHWAAENNHLQLAELLLQQGANPNICNFSGQSPLVMPMLRRHGEMRQLLMQHGADVQFAQDFINTKLLGHFFELVGMGTILGPNNQYVDVDFEGFYLEVTLGLVANSLIQFQNHFAARQLKPYAQLAQFIAGIIERANQLIKWQQYRTDLKKYQTEIETLLRQEPLLIPVGYEGHAITFIRYGDIWIKCDRREDSRLYDNIMLYKVRNVAQLTPQLFSQLIYKKQSDHFINVELDRLLGLEPFTELKVNAQVSGNCSWANVEATIPALFFLLLMQIQPDEKLIAQHKATALQYFHRWQEWNKERALQFCIQRYHEGGALRKACQAEMLVAVLFQRCNYHEPKDIPRIETILNIILHSPYEYLLKNYLKTYYYEGHTEEGKRFAAMLKEYGYLK